MKTLLDVLAACGGTLGVIAFLWRVWDEFGSYLYLGLEVKTDVPGYAVVVARVENSGLPEEKPKRSVPTGGTLRLRTRSRPTTRSLRALVSQRHATPTTS